MKLRFFTILFLIVRSSLVFAQQDSGFTNKSEAKNLMVNGLKEGKWVEYFTVDNIQAKDTSNQIYFRLVVYKSGLQNGIAHEYYPTGELYSKTAYKNGQESGIVKYFYKSGKLEQETHFSNGKENGINKVFYENGKVRSITIYTNGVEGKTTNYFENGSEIDEKKE
jgi:antitoxin component YwqK of YwqJK toxin-antitoxin module